jgi:hypothetical protein
LPTDFLAGLVAALAAGGVVFLLAVMMLTIQADLLSGLHSAAKT